MVKANLSQFLKEVEAKTKEYEKKRVDYAKSVIVEANNMLINASPVNTGLFRSNHIMTYNTKTSATREDTTPPPISIQSQLFKNGDTITFQNNLQYADALEAGHSKQASAGVYGVTEEKLRVKLSKRSKV